MEYGYRSHAKRAPVVIDFGSRYLKCGFSGDCTPHQVKSWQLWRYMESQPPLDFEAWGKHLSRMVSDIFTKILKVSARSRRVLIVEEKLSLRAFREALASVLFKSFKVSSVNFISSLEVIPFATGYSTALIIDSGWRGTRVVPLYHSSIIYSAYQETCVGSGSVAKQVHRELVDMQNNAQNVLSRCEDRANICHDFSQEVDIVEDIVSRACLVVDQSSDTSGMESIDFPLQGNTTVEIPKNVQLVPSQVLFQDGDSIAIAVLEALLKSPIDTRADIISNIVSVGGTSMMEGYHHCLKSETDQLVCSDERYKTLRLVLEKYPLKFVPIYFAPNLVTWIGASVYSSLDVCSNSALSSEQYFEEHERLSDWLSIAEREF